MKVLMLRHNLHQLVLKHAGEVFAVLDQSEGCRSLPQETLARFARVYWISSYDSLEELSAIAGDLLTRGVGVERVVSFAEFTQYAAGYLSNLLRIPHFSPSLALASRDKRVTKDLAARAGLRVARWSSIPDAAEGADLDAIEEAVGFPLVLKPASGWGAVSTVKVEDRERLAGALEAFAKEPVDAVSRQLVAEEFIVGDEFHVDAVWRDGQPWIFHISRYLSPRLRAWTGRSPQGSVMLSENEHVGLYRRMREIHERLNAALGIRRGATHLEVFEERGSGRIIVSEIATRVGGANVSDMIEARTGVHGGVVALHELLDGEFADLAFTEGAFPAIGGLCLVPDRSGVIEAVPSRTELLRHPNVVDAAVYRKAGDVVEVSHPSAWCALLIVGAASGGELLEIMDDLSTSYSIEMA